MSSTTITRQPIHDGVEAIARARIRSLRQSLGWSLDRLAAQSNLSASTISRIETGKRSIGLDVLVAIAGALRVDVSALLDVSDADADVVIRPEPSRWRGITTWLLSRPTSSTVAIKMRLTPTRRFPEPQVHPGHDWMFVVSGRVLLRLGGREHVVTAGEAAEFSTMTPHAFAAIDVPAELIMIFDRDGHRAHVHADERSGSNRRR